ncbi:uncharacterized protein EV420DRAFT_1631407 [Desarmillaria tabescens]|uniref:Fe2OG dioxygenase domain-containing protein n=1 Tax=Armillaria tabescens TaxID=1929756 RepID=A0AA39JJH4_ARMTA|nr:uncharacterized protein EV420DRAFT_1631407 [Desarmillaria tabescens]KAK0443920.1 hypothetical protein EV420DRAFT_1631407 [Desarmillaria tabescens]
MDSVQTESAVEPHLSTFLDSLFDEPFSPLEAGPAPAALIDAPPIPGLFFTPSLRLPADLADSVMNYCLETFFTADSPSSGLPPLLTSLLDVLSDLLRPTLPPEIHSLLFPTVPTRARQAIINRYDPGEGITAPSLAVGVSCSSRLDSKDQAVWSVPPERSIIVMSGDARYNWTHGIEKKTADYVQSPDMSAADRGRWVERTMRVSITFRWLLPGAEVVGGA